MVDTCMINENGLSLSNETFSFCRYTVMKSNDHYQEHSMSKRKFRLYTPKGYSRKRFKTSNSTDSETHADAQLTVHFPFEAFASTCLPDIDSLHTRLNASLSLSLKYNGWILSRVQGGLESESQLFKLQVMPSNALVDHTFMLTISPDCKWNLHLQRLKVQCEKCPPLIGLPTYLNSVTAICNVLSILDKHKVCPGNPDENFKKLIYHGHHEGRFMDRSGV